MSETLLKQITDMRLKGSKLRRVPRSQIKDRSRAVIPKIKQNKDLPDRLELPEPVASTYTGLPEIPAPKIATYEFRDYSSKAPKQHFECPTCTKQFSVKNVPKVLECGESVCQECVVNVVNNIDKELNEFHCQACGECHAIPEYRVFKNNKFLLKLLKLPYFPAIPKDPEVLAIKEDLQKAPVIIAEPTPGTSSNIETSEPIQEPEELKNITEKPKKLSPEPVKVRDPSPEVIETEEPCEKDEEELNQIPEPIDEDIVEKPVKKSFNKKVKVIDSDFDVLLEKTLKSEAPKTGSSSGGGGSGSKLQQLEVILTRYDMILNRIIHQISIVQYINFIK